MNKLQVSKSTIRDGFCAYIQPWQGKQLPTGAFITVDKMRSISVLLHDLCNAIEDLGMNDDPLPADAVRKLELFDGATYAHACALLLWAWEQPIEQTPEEETEEEQLMSMSVASRHTTYQAHRKRSARLRA